MTGYPGLYGNVPEPGYAVASWHPRRNGGTGAYVRRELKGRGLGVVALAESTQRTQGFCGRVLHVVVEADELFLLREHFAQPPLHLSGVVRDLHRVRRTGHARQGDSVELRRYGVTESWGVLEYPWHVQKDPGM